MGLVVSINRGSEHFPQFRILYTKSGIDLGVWYPWSLQTVVNYIPQFFRCLCHKVMIPGLCFGFKNCKKLPIIQQRQVPVPTHVLKAAFSNHVLTELRHFYIIAFLCQPRIPRFFLSNAQKTSKLFGLLHLKNYNTSFSISKRGAVAQVVRAPV